MKEWDGGERYGDTHDDYYGEFRANIGASEGDVVEVWFSGRNVTRNGGSTTVSTVPFTYTVHDDIGGDVLILAAEDVTGLSPVQGLTSAQFVDEYASSLEAAGYTSDVYDFDVMGRQAPHHLGVLSHYDAVVWETGNDIILRSVGQVPAARRPRRRSTSSCPSATTSTRAARRSSRASTRCSPRRPTVRTAYNPFQPPECTTPQRLPVPAGAERLPAVLAGRLRQRQ